MFYQEDQYLRSFLRCVISFMYFYEDNPEGKHEAYLDESLDSVLDLWTGEEDETNKKIFPGDILSDGVCNTYTVDHGWAGNGSSEHYAKCYILSPVCHDGDIEQLSPDKAKECAIIGNIHETPELLDNPNLK